MTGLLYQQCLQRGEDQDAKLYECLMGRLKETFRQEREGDRLPEVVVGLLATLPAELFRQEEPRRMLALIEMLETMIYCKKERFLVEKAVGLLSVFGKSGIQPAVECIRRVLDSLKVESISAKH
jgi:hypothetical protein